MTVGLARESRTRRMMILRRQTGAAASGIHPRLAALRKILRGDGPATWVFTGEDAGATHAERRTLANVFESEIRDARHRHDDVVVDTTRPRDRTAALCQNVRPRVLRFEADAAFLLLGAGDPRPERIRQETIGLTRTCQILMENGCTPVLLPPPQYMLGDADAIDRMRQRVQIVADQLFLPTIDIADCRRPTDAGRRLLEAVGYNVENDVRPIDAEEITLMMTRAEQIAAGAL